MTLQKLNYSSSRVIKAKNKVKLSAFGLRVLKKIRSGTCIVPLACGGGKLGSLSVPSSLLAELISRDLLDKNNDGQLTLSQAGASLLRRNAVGVKGVAGGQMVGERVSEPYLLQHQIPTTVTRKVNGVAKKFNVNLAESPLGWLRKRKNKSGEYLVSLDHFDAAERFRCDYEMGTNSKRLTANYDGVPISKGMRGGSSSMMYTERQLDAKKRYEKAVAAMGSGLADSVIRLCCHLEGFEAAERALGWPSRSMKLVTIMALDRLVAHYK